MLEVVHIINALPKIGGAERLILDMARAHKPWHMRVITWFSPDIGLCSQDSEDALEVLALRPVTFAKLRQAKRWILEADLLHVHLFPSIYLALFLPGPKLYTEHNTWNRRRAHRSLRFLERLVYRRYDCVVAISQAVRSALIDWLSPSSVPVSVIDNGITLDRFPNVQRVLQQDLDTIAVGMAGSFSDQKHQELLVRVLTHLPDRVCLVFAGDGPRKAQVETLARTLGVAERVTFLGNIDDMPSYYRGIDIYIQSSHWEGFGLTVVEAMASGLPCLASDVPGLAEVVGDRAKLFSNDDARGLSAIIKSLIESPCQYKDWSLYSIERSKHYSIGRMVTAYGELYDTILAGQTLSGR